MYRSGLLLAAVLVLSANFAAATPLDDYLGAPDSNFTYGPTPVNTVTGAGYTGYIWWMRSQAWRDSSEVDRPLWEHWVNVVRPSSLMHDTALLYIGGGSNGGSAPTEVDPMLANIGVMTNSLTVELRMIPNQPLHFADEQDPEYVASGRTEDELIAYAWDKFYRTGDPTWLPRLPMTKAVLRAMDLIQAEYPQVQKFVIAGGSKRGWTTWTTAASNDPRVVAIIPCVIDVLNVENSMRHHYDAYGYWADAIGDYERMGVMNWMHTPEFRNLMAVVDPISYVDRMTMPKFIVNSTGDQFFLPDSWQFYFDALEGEKHLRYVPNTDHGLNFQAWEDMLAFYESILNNVPRPEYSWQRLPDGSLRVQTVTTPTAVTLWQATNPNERNFRLDTIGAAWTSTPLEGDGGEYVASVPAPDQGWTAFMIELEFESGGAAPFKFTTGVSVVPDTLPYRNVRGWGRISTVPNGAHPIKVVEVGGDRYQMGYWYGKLLAADISQCLGGMMNTFSVPEAMFDEAIAAMWDNSHFDTTGWELELRGAADGCLDAGYPDVTYRLLQKAMVLPDMSELGCSLMAAWGAATEDGKTFQFRNLDWNMDTGMQDYPVVAIYNPTDGIRHATMASAGVIGAICGGMNEYGLAFSQIMGYFCDAEGLDGIPMPVLLRDVLYHDVTVDQAVNRVFASPRTNQYHYAFADAVSTGKKGKLLFTSATRCDVYEDESVVGHPCVSPDPFHTAMPGVVYWKNHNGSGNQLLFNAINDRYGQINGESAIDIAKLAGVNGTVFSVVYGNSDLDFWAAWANGLEPAQKQDYHHFSLAVGGSGYRTSIYAGSREIPLIVVSGTPYEMGYHYGRLMIDDVRTLLIAFYASITSDEEFSAANLDAAWYAMEPYMDTRYAEEMQGLADAAQLDFHDVRGVHAMAALDSYACSSVAAWG
ncbi:MAG: C45 family autoproteolytic acyltransferase/hydrolase, partial [Candidatus Hydrogenedentes bacterium]|nr:C45 family autoproteolytic acyltransferase/hydrolase [Candidatus Hydrogenedentota bacterium]